MELEKREKVLIRALRSCSDWADRKTLAAALNLGYLNPKDIVLLEIMADQGKIEMRSVQGNMRNVNRFEYRLKA